MMWHDGWQWGWGGYLAMVLMMVLFWGAVVLLVVWAIKQFRPEGGSRPAPPPPGPDPVRILEERFARGEIDAEEFEQRREVLRRGAGGAP